MKHWLYETLDAEWHWYRYEFQARGSIHCHGTAKLKSDPGLCKPTDIALKGFVAEKCQNGCDNSSLSKEISDGKKASKIICEYVNRLITTWNPCQPQNEMWSKPHVHPCSRQHKDIDDSQQTDDYIDLINTVQRHTTCSTRYCLKHETNKEGLHCRFNYPIECSDTTKLEFQPVHTKDKSKKYKATIVTARNDPRLNTHQKIQLLGWRDNCDMQVILDYHACVEYLCKYAAKGEPRSNTLRNTFNAVVNNLKTSTDPLKVMKKIMIKSLGERDFSSQETMHLLLSLKLHSSSFQVLPVNLDGSRSVKKQIKDSNSSCTNDSILDKYAKRAIFQNDLPLIMNISFTQFVTLYKFVKNKIVTQEPNVVPRFFLLYYPLYCKYQLLKYKPWKDSQNDAWNYETPSDTVYVNAWLAFLNSPVASKYVPNWEKQLENVLDNVVQKSDDEFHSENENKSIVQEEWMILSTYHKLNDKHEKCENSYDWQLDSAKYTIEQIASMINWIKVQKTEYIATERQYEVHISMFSEKQQLAYDIIVNHQNTAVPKEQLLLIINGEGETGKSYLINAIQSYLRGKSEITATTGKAAFNVNGITIHSFLKLPVGRVVPKDLAGQSLHTLQMNLLSVEYIIIDEYSMLGQIAMGWIDRRCRQATGLKNTLFGGKSIILIGDPGQLPPVADKPL